MKVLFVHDYLGALGGAENTLLLAATELKARGHQVGLLYRRPTGRNEDRWIEVFGSHLFRSVGWGNIEHTEAALGQFQPEVLFIHNLKEMETFAALLTLNIPVVRMLHDHALYCLREYKYNFFTRAVCHRAASGFCVFPCMATVLRNHDGKLPIKFASYTDKVREIELNRRCDHFFVYSDYCRQELVRNGFDRDRIHRFVPIRPQPDQTIQSSFSNRNLVLFAGQVIRGKGVDILLRALARVETPFECVIMGDGSHRPVCERLARKLNLSNRVRFTGFLGAEQMRQYYMDASVVAVSSVWPEPFGLVGPEAMQFGLPVVAFDAGGIGEWLHHNETGFLIPWMDTAAFANAIERLLRDKDLARALGARGRERIARDYDLGLQIDRVESLFYDLIKDKQINEDAGINVVHGNG